MAARKFMFRWVRLRVIAHGWIRESEASLEWCMVLKELHMTDGRSMETPVIRVYKN
jgi:hypothetical protein